MEQSPLSEADSCLIGREIPRPSVTQRFITVFTRSRHWIILSQMNPIHILFRYSPLRYYCTIY